MGIASQYLENDELLVVVWHGRVSGAEWEHFAREQLAGDPNWPIGKRRFADITTLEPSLLSLADIETVTALFRDRVHNLAGSRQAIVATLAWDLAREYERHIDRLGSTTIVFNQFQTGCTWLGIDPVSTADVVATLRTRLRDDI
jgi:hypothetical protein